MSKALNECQHLTLNSKSRLARQEKAVATKFPLFYLPVCTPKSTFALCHLSVNSISQTHHVRYSARHSSKSSQPLCFGRNLCSNVGGLDLRLGTSSSKATLGIELCLNKFKETHHCHSWLIFIYTMAPSPPRLRILSVGGNQISAFLSWRLQATNACDVTLVWKSGYEAVAQYGISFK